VVAFDYFRIPVIGRITLVLFQSVIGIEDSTAATGNIAFRSRGSGGNVWPRHYLLKMVWRVTSILRLESSGLVADFGYLTAFILGG
jgi:hypothetical protein